jgi:hypothetical protein
MVVLCYHELMRWPGQPQVWVGSGRESTDEPAPVRPVTAFADYEKVYLTKLVIVAYAVHGPSQSHQGETTYPAFAR